MKKLIANGLVLLLALLFVTLGLSSSAAAEHQQVVAHATPNAEAVQTQVPTSTFKATTQLKATKITPSVVDPGGGGSSYPYTTGQCQYAQMNTWLATGNGWGYYCRTDGFIWYWSVQSGWRYLGWD